MSFAGLASDLASRTRRLVHPVPYYFTCDESNLYEEAHRVLDRAFTLWRDSWRDAGRRDHILTALQSSATRPSQLDGGPSSFGAEFRSRPPVMLVDCRDVAAVVVAARPEWNAIGYVTQYIDHRARTELGVSGPEVRFVESTEDVAGLEQACDLEQGGIVFVGFRENSRAALTDGPDARQIPREATRGGGPSRVSTAGLAVKPEGEVATTPRGRGGRRSTQRSRLRERGEASSEK